MEKIEYFLAIILLAILFKATDGISRKDRESALIGYLLRSNNAATVPKLNRKEAVVVTFGIQLIQVIELYDAEQLLTSKYWVRQSWFNELLTWNSTEWGNIEEITIDASLVWTPDIVLYNNGGSEFSGGTEKYSMPIIMRHDGKHQWLSPATFTSSCRVHANFFPFDGQSCELKFGSWTLNTAKLALKNDQLPVIGTNYIPSTEWNVVKATGVQHSVCYEHYGPIPYDDVTFTIKMARKGMSYLLYLICPCLIVVCTTLFSFSLPPESGERIIVLVTNLLCFALFLFMTSEVLPRNSDNVAIISIFYIVLMVESAISILVACFIMTVYDKAREPTPPQVPGAVKALCARFYTQFEKASSTSTSFAPGLESIKEKLEPIRKEQDSKGAEAITEDETDLEKEENVSTQETVVLDEIFEELRYAGTTNKKWKKRELLRREWETIGYILDRLYFWLFLVMVIFSCACIAVVVLVAKANFHVPSHEDHGHHEEIGENENATVLEYVVKRCHHD